MYSTVSAIVKLLPEYEILKLADDESAGVLTDPAVTAVLEEAIEQADREIDAYVGTVKTVPLTSVPALIENLSTKLAIHNLYLRRPGVDEPETWQRETARCMRLLEAVATGKMALGAESGETSEPSQGTASFTANPRLMTRGTL
jgi:phage gp36-like protein